MSLTLIQNTQFKINDHSILNQWIKWRAMAACGSKSVQCCYDFMMFNSRSILLRTCFMQVPSLQLGADLYWTIRLNNFLIWKESSRHQLEDSPAVRWFIGLLNQSSVFDKVQDNHSERSLVVSIGTQSTDCIATEQQAKATICGSGANPLRQLDHFRFATRLNRLSLMRLFPSQIGFAVALPLQMRCLRRR